MERETLQAYGFLAEGRTNSEPRSLEVVRSSLPYDPQLGKVLLTFLGPAPPNLNH